MKTGQAEAPTPPKTNGVRFYKLAPEVRNCVHGAFSYLRATMPARSGNRACAIASVILCSGVALSGTLGRGGLRHPLRRRAADQAEDFRGHEESVNKPAVSPSFIRGLRDHAKNFAAEFFAIFCAGRARARRCRFSAYYSRLPCAQTAGGRARQLIHPIHFFLKLSAAFVGQPVSLFVSRRVFLLEPFDPAVFEQTDEARRRASRCLAGPGRR